MKTSNRQVLLPDLWQKIKNVVVSSSSNDESDIMDFVDESDSGSEEDSDENVDNLHADEVEADELRTT